MKLRSAIALFFLFTGQAYAYVPDSKYVLDQWLRQSRGSKTIHVYSKKEIFDPSFSGGSITVTQEVWVKKPSFFRRSTQFPKGTVHDILGPKQAVRVAPDGLSRISPFDVLEGEGIFYFYEDARRFISFLEQYNIKTAQTGWNLEDRQIGYVIGDLTANRVVLTKDSWTPYSAHIGDKEYRFNLPLPSSFAIPYPIAVETRIGQRLVEKTVIEKLELNLPMADQIFDASTLRAPRDKK